MKNPTTVSGKLRKAKSIIEEKGWCKHNAAQTAGGISVAPASRRAAKFCSLGAIMRASPAGNFGVIEAFKAANSITCVASFNDSRTSVKVILNAFDKAIRYAEKAEKSA